MKKVPVSQGRTEGDMGVSNKDMLHYMHTTQFLHDRGCPSDALYELPLLITPSTGQMCLGADNKTIVQKKPT